MSHRFFSATLVFGSFLLFSILSSPVPGVNEPHYLGKAKHYWDRSWCRGDFFLESADTHVVFYETFGRMTRWLDLMQTAWVGRLLGMLVLGIGWDQLVSRILPGSWTSLWSAWVFLLLVSLGNLSGEWIVGGIEAKVVAYGFVFLALAFLIDQRWCHSAICCGLAISFHPIVSIWSLLAGGLAAVCTSRPSSPANLLGGQIGEFLCPTQDDPNLNSPGQHDGQDLDRTADGGGSGWGHRLFAVLLLVIFALPGLVPVLELLDTTSEKISFQANYIQVYYRLAHHLDPRQFSMASYGGYLLLLIFWTASYRCQRVVMFVRGRRIFTGYLAGTLMIALAGLMIGLGPKPVENMQYAFRLSLMKFYPFRTFDVALPIAGSLALLAFWLQRIRATTSGNGRIGVGGWKSWILFGCILSVAISASASRHHVSRMSLKQRKDWMDACQWISQNVAPGAVFLTPRNSWAFKWYARRAEYVSFKDCPQDATRVIEWNQRLRYLKHWAEENFDNGYTVDALHALQKRTGITHIIAPFRTFGPFEAPQIFQNGSYKVFQVVN